MARRSHCTLSIIARSEDAKVERARAGRAVVGEHRKLAIAGGDQDGWRFTVAAPGGWATSPIKVHIDGGRYSRSLCPGKPTRRTLRLDQPLTQLWSLGIESIFIFDPMNARLLDDIRFNTTSRLVVMTLRPYIISIHHAMHSVPYLTTLRIAADRMNTPVKILQHLHHPAVFERSFARELLGTR